jgi:hypothetical protein
LKKIEKKEKKAKTRDVRQLPPYFYDMYKIFDDQEHTDCITSFSQIGMLDPFPQEAYLEGTKSYGKSYFQAPLYVNDFVYSEHKYIQDSSPFILYKPRKDLLFKMMRACINVKTES